MRSANWKCSWLLASVLLVVPGTSCKDSLTPETSGALASRFHAGADVSMSRDDDDDDDDNDNGHADVRICPAGAPVGVIAETVVIKKSTKLTCDVQCGLTSRACIEFGADGITLWLNGHIMTGPAVPPANCAASPAFGPGNPGPFPWDAISTAGHDRVRIRGPGMVQQFRRHGIFVFESERAVVEHVTSHYNCFSGLFLGLSNRNDVTDNVSVRNGIASAAAPCGGNCISNSNHNRVRRNHYHGNGASAPANDFGVGLVGTSTSNVIEENSIGGNINGVFIAAPAVGNRIVHNIIAGNPPVQLSFGSGPPLGADIRDFSPANANTFRENHCITYLGATMPPPCPNFPRSRRGREFD